MNRLFMTMLSLLLVAIVILPLSAKAIYMDADLPDGVYCEINDVKLFASSAEDCAKAGGTVTHSITTTVEPANPNQETEIQRAKDKEPVAP